MNRQSTEIVRVPVAATGSDPTLYPVRMAFLPPGVQPSDSDWHLAAWVDGAAEVLVGPDGGALTLTVGPWRIWIDIDASIEHPVIPGPDLIIT